MKFSKFMAAAAAAVITATAVIAPASADKIEVKTKVDLSASGITTSNANTATYPNPISADTVYLKDVQENKGAKNPKDYITYTATETGTLSFTFSCDNIKNASNLPRMYWHPDSVTGASKEVDQAAERRIAQAEGANKDTSATLNVTKGSTYIIYGYNYNMTVETHFTVKNMTFTKTVDATTANTYTENGETTLKGFYGTANLSDGTTKTVTMYLNNGKVWSNAVKLGTQLSGSGDVSFGVVVDGGETDISGYKAAYELK